MELTLVLSETTSIELTATTIRRVGVEPLEIALADIKRMSFSKFRSDGWCELTARNGKKLIFSTNVAGFRFNANGLAVQFRQFDELVAALYQELSRRSDVTIVTGNTGLAVLNAVVATFLFYFAAIRLLNAFTMAVLAFLLAVAFARWSWQRIPRRFRGTALPRVGG